jgi:hypothetical protein
MVPLAWSASAAPREASATDPARAKETDSSKGSLVSQARERAEPCAVGRCTDVHALGLDWLLATPPARALRRRVVQVRRVMRSSLTCAVFLLAGWGGHGTQAADRMQRPANFEFRSGAFCPGTPRLGASNATFVGRDLAFDRYTARQGAELQSSRAQGGGRFSKLGLFLRHGASAELRVPEHAPRTVRLSGWTSARPSRVITVTDDVGTSCWQGNPGGFLFDKPICLELRVETGSRTAVIPFGLGRDC